MANAKQTKPRLFLMPLAVGLLFAALMVFLAVISTEKAREHYKSNRIAESIQKLSRSMNRGPIQPPPLKTKSWFAKYDIKILIVALFLAIVGIRLGLMVIGRRGLPNRNPFGLDDSMRRSLLAMVCSFVLSPACFFAYIWALRVGVIGL